MSLIDTAAKSRRTVDLNVLNVNCLFSLAVARQDVAEHRELGWHVEVV